MTAHETTLTAWLIRDATRTSKKAKQKAKKGDPKPKEPLRPFVRMHKDEPAMFLSFATSLKLYDYLAEFKRVRFKFLTAEFSLMSFPRSTVKVI